MVYSTRCMGCGQERKTPEQPFDELDLSIEGVRSVEEALAQYLAVEQLRNENQYECGICQRRRDAERCTKILKTPSVLCLYLMRYGYDRETFERKKLTSEVAFSDTIELHGDKYKLVSVLYHKGRSAYGGHYVCDALDWETAEWWHYDDTSVQATVNPTMETSPASSSAADKNSAENATPLKRETVAVIDLHVSAVSSTCNSLVSTPRARKAREAEEKSDGGEWIETSSRETSRTKVQTSSSTGAAVSVGKAGVSTESGRKRTAAATEAKTSKKRVVEVDLTADKSEGTAKVGVNRKKDAYMLTYVKGSEYEAALHTKRCEPSEALKEEVSHSSADYLEQVRKYDACKDALLKEVDERKHAYETIRLQMTPPVSLAKLTDHKFCLVPSLWLNKWIKGDPATLMACEGKLPLKRSPALSVAPLGKNEPASIDLTVDEDEMQVVDLQSQDPGDGDDAAEDGEVLSASGEVNVEGRSIGTLCYICPHGGLNTAHVDKFKVMSLEASKVLFHSTGSWQKMDFELTDANYRCDTCYDSMVHQRKAVQSQASKNEHILHLVDESPSSGSSGDEDGMGIDLGYYVSKKWLEQFRRITATLQKSDPSKSKPTAFAKIFTLSNVKAEGAVDGTAEASAATSSNELPLMSSLDPAVNTLLFCEHKHPAASFVRRAHRLSQAAWEAIVDLFPDARPIHGSAQGCQRCQEDIERATAATRENKASRFIELENPALNQLNKMKRIYPTQFEDEASVSSTDPVVTKQVFNVVDGMWLAHWRKYISDPNFPAPDPLTNERLRCQHGCRSYLPPVIAKLEDGILPKYHDDVDGLLVRKFLPLDLFVSASISAAGVENDCGFSIVDGPPKPAPFPAVELITADQWFGLLNLHSHGARTAMEDAARSGPAIFDLGTDKVIPSRRPASTSTDQSMFEVRWQFDGHTNKWAFLPTNCAECAAAHDKHRDAAATVYVNASMPVVHMRDEMDFFKLFHKEAAPLSGTSAESQDGVRRSSRTTRGKRLINSSIIADSTDLLSIVRLKICGAFAIDLPPGRQKLFDSKGKPLLSNTLTLGEYNIKAGDKLYVLEGEGDGGEWGFADCWNVGGGSSSRGAEHGFGGTLLQRSGTLPASAVTSDIASRSSSGSLHSGVGAGVGAEIDIKEEEEEDAHNLRLAMELSKQDYSFASGRGSGSFSSNDGRTATASAHSSEKVSPRESATASSAGGSLNTAASESDEGQPVSSCDLCSLLILLIL